MLFYPNFIPTENSYIALFESGDENETEFQRDGQDYYFERVKQAGFELIIKPRGIYAVKIQSIGHPHD